MISKLFCHYNVFHKSHNFFFEFFLPPSQNVSPSATNDIRHCLPHQQNAFFFETAISVSVQLCRVKNKYAKCWSLLLQFTSNSSLKSNVFNAKVWHHTLWPSFHLSNIISKVWTPPPYLRCDIYKQSLTWKTINPCHNPILHHIIYVYIHKHNINMIFINSKQICMFHLVEFCMCTLFFTANSLCCFFILAHMSVCYIFYFFCNYFKFVHFCLLNFLYASFVWNFFAAFFYVHTILCVVLSVCLCFCVFSCHFSVLVQNPFFLLFSVFASISFKCFVSIINCFFIWCHP